MKKIPTIFDRDPDNRAHVLPKQNPACSWVFAGEGIATRKYDGTCCLMNRGKLYKRREVKPGNAPPPDFWEIDHDDVTGKTVGWVPVNTDAKEDRWHAEAFDGSLPDGTYELVGPRVQGNPEHAETHKLICHADAEVLDAPRDFVGLREWMKGRDIEGIVWHHEDGRMAKIKLRDFGIDRR